MISVRGGGDLVRVRIGSDRIFAHDRGQRSARVVRRGGHWIGVCASAARNVARPLRGRAGHVAGRGPDHASSAAGRNSH